jgi:hypothetical protein
VIDDTRGAGTQAHTEKVFKPPGDIQFGRMAVIDERYRKVQFCHISHFNPSVLALMLVLMLMLV